LGWDRFGRALQNKWYKNSTVLDQVDYTYDYVGNRLTRNVAAPSNDTRDQKYTYDGLHRLKSFDGGTLTGSDITTLAKSQDWTLDQFGNWFGFNEDSDGNGTNNLVQTRYHNDVNEIAGNGGNAITASTGANWADPAYDAAGNATTLPAPLNLTSALTLKYDAWNRLVEVKNASNVVITANKYDGLNRRIVRDEPGGTGVTRYYYNEQWQVMVEATGTGTPTPTAIYAYHPHYVDAIAHRMRANDSHTYLHDANFNVTVVLEPDSDVAERYSYSPYGEVTVLDANFANPATSSSIGNEILYTGRERDPSTGLQLNRERFFTTSLGRWVNRDPYVYGGGLNLYEYVDSRPVFYLDPSGLAGGYDSPNPHTPMWIGGPVPSDITPFKNPNEGKTCGIDVLVYTGSYCVPDDIWYAAWEGAGQGAVASPINGCYVGRSFTIGSGGDKFEFGGFAGYDIANGGNWGVFGGYNGSVPGVDGSHHLGGGYGGSEFGGSGFYGGYINNMGPMHIGFDNHDNMMIGGNTPGGFFGGVSCDCPLW
jgi:RHS repeat-associated protein